MDQDLARKVVERIRRVVGAGRVALHEPRFDGNELAYVKECIETGWVSSVGSYVDRFERDLADYVGAKHAIAVSNATSGLQVALQLVGVGPGDEVLVPALSFVATANAVSHCAALPHFVDSDYSSLGVGVEALNSYLREITCSSKEGCFNRRTGRRISAMVPMHTFGHPVDMCALKQLSECFGIPIVEDAAESLGSWLEGRHTGTFGDCAVFSFNGNKVITTGGGGAIVTNDSSLAKRAKHITTTAKVPHAWAYFHDQVAYNFRLPNINAALGCAQLEQIDRLLSNKRLLTERYIKVFADVGDATLFVERHGTRANYWLQTLLLSRAVADRRDEILAATNAAGQMTRPVWDLLPTLPMYESCEAMPLPIASDLAKRIINLPSSSHLVQVEL